MNDGPRATDSALRTANNGQQTTDNGHQTMDNGRPRTNGNTDETGATAHGCSMEWPRWPTDTVWIGHDGPRKEE